MPGFARKYLISEGADCLVHTISRCVRRSWLCGEDSYTGKNFEHRREWVRDRARQLVGVFAIEVCAYAVMSNHSHFVLWCRPSVAAEWSPEEVVRRWLKLFGRRVNGPTAEEVARYAADETKVALWRGRLGNVSWFMRCLNEWLARKANEEDECTGRFWEGRFRCQLLEDEGAALACMAYVDLNPVRAKMAASLEDSRLTSVHDRLCARRARQQVETMRKSDRLAGNPTATGEAERKRPPLTKPQEEMLEKAREESGLDEWLCPFGEGKGHTVLGMPLEDYLELLEWTGKCVVEGKHGSLPEASLPVLVRMELEVDNWVETVERYGSIYHRVAGKVETLRRKAAEFRQGWLSGQRKSRGVFRRRMPEAREKV